MVKRNYKKRILTPEAEQRVWKAITALYGKLENGGAQPEERRRIHGISRIVHMILKRRGGVSAYTKAEIESLRRENETVLSGRLGFPVGRERKVSLTPVRWWRHAAAGVAACIVLAAGLFSYHTLFNAGQRGGKVYVCRADTTFFLKDGTEVRMRGGSRLVQSYGFGVKERQLSLEGMAHFKVARDAMRTFTVSAGGMEAIVHGTSFTVMAYPSLPVRTVTVSAGCVEVADEERGVSFGRYRRNWEVLYTPATGKAVRRRVNAASLDDWMHGRFELENASRDELVEKVRIHFAKELVIRDNALPEGMSLTLPFRHVVPSEQHLMQALEDVYCVRCVRSGNRLLVRPR